MDIKKPNILLMLSICLGMMSAFISCSKDDSIIEDADGDLDVLELTSFSSGKEFSFQPGGLGVSFNGKNNMVWSENDSLLVFAENGDEVSSAWFLAGHDVSSTSTDFKILDGKRLRGKKFTVVYNKNNKDITYLGYGKVSGLKIPLIQKVVRGSFDPTAVPMIGKIESDMETEQWSVTIRPICSFVKVVSEDTCNWLELRGAEDARLTSDNITVDYSGDEILLSTDNAMRSVILDGARNKETTFMAVLPGKVGKSLIAMMSDKNANEGYYCTQESLGDDYTFKRNVRHSGVKFNTDDTQKWQQLESKRLLKYNTKGENGKEYYTWQEAQDYVKAHPAFRIIHHDDFLNGNDRFYYTNSLRFNPSVGAYIDWHDLRYYFPVNGYKTESATDTFKLGDSSFTWLDLYGAAGHTEFTKNRTASFRRDTNNKNMYNLRLKIH